ncbi:FAD:protein FMN transferase [Shewanella donghaensis]|uniref:FAD:protein FMN transferase n=1 Tax=Shewanella donghaensis TaxID=238836 RepID=UPI00131529C1|nr:FAD:protein FMN transferase [Shewanella donghaensis]
MGNNYKVTWTESKITAERMAAIRDELNQRLEDVNNSMSNWRDDSEITAINNISKNTSVKISRDLERVINEAISIHELTRGSLDITVGPLVDLWGFGPNGLIESLPSDQDIANAKAKIGVHHIVINDHHISKNTDGLQIDLSSIAKGFGVDVIAEVLERNNIHNFLVDIGGELRIKGVNANKELWKVGIDKPFAYSSGQIEIITPGDSAVATSGDYRKYFEKNGQHYSHLIDPRSGKPVTHNIVSATVIEKTSMTADALATAFMVLPRAESIEIANKNNIAIMIIEDNFGRLKTYYSDSFKKFIK